MLILKIILLTLLALLLAVILALFLPISVFFSYNKKPAVKVYYCGIPVFSTAHSKKEKSDKKEKQTNNEKDENKKEKNNIFKEVYDKLGFNDTVRYFAGLLKIVVKKLGWVLKKIKIRRFTMSLAVSDSDAAQTAIQYGRICSAVYPALSLLFSVTDCKAERVDVSADFNHTSSSFSISFAVRTLPIFLIIAAVTGLWEYKKYKGVNLDE